MSRLKPRPTNQALRPAQLVQHEFVDVAPAPVLSRLDRLDDRVLAAMIVLGRVLVLRGIAAAHMAADQAHPQMHPRISRFQTILASVGAGLYVFDFLDVRTGFHHCHDHLLSAERQYSLVPYSAKSPHPVGRSVIQERARTQRSKSIYV